MKTNLVPTRNLIKYFHALYRNFPDDFSKEIDKELKHSILNELINNQIYNFNPLEIESRQVISDQSYTKNIEVLSFVNNVLEFEVEWIITFDLIPKKLIKFAQIQKFIAQSLY